MSARLFALSFIGIIILANVWMGQSAFGGKVSEWVPLAFMSLMLSSFIAGAVMTVSKLVAHFFGTSESST